MAKQKGFLNITGTLGDTTFAQTKDGFQARVKSRLSAAQLKTSPAFARTRENNTEFGRAGAAGKLLRNAVNTLLNNAQAPGSISRLVKKMMEVIRQDLTSSRGKRNVIDGPITLLDGYEFNPSAIREVVMKAVVTSTINRVTGELTINIPSFIPAFRIVPPAGVTHFKLVSAGIELNFEQKTYKRDQKESATIAWDKTPTAVMNIVHTVTPNSTNPLFLVFGVQFYQSVGGVMNPMLDGTGNLLTIIDVSKP